MPGVWVSFHRMIYPLILYISNSPTHHPYNFFFVCLGFDDNSSIYYWTTSPSLAQLKKKPLIRSNNMLDVRPVVFALHPTNSNTTTRPRTPSRLCSPAFFAALTEMHSSFLNITVYHSLH